MERVTFRILTVGENFVWNGILMQKKSSRTADLHYNGNVRRFYMRQLDTCLIPEEGERILLDSNGSYKVFRLGFGA